MTYPEVNNQLNSVNLLDCLCFKPTTAIEQFKHFFGYGAGGYFSLINKVNSAAIAALCSIDGIETSYNICILMYILEGSRSFNLILMISR